MTETSGNTFIKNAKNLAANTFFPAAYVTIGSLPSVQTLLPSFTWKDLTEIELSFKPKAIGEFFQNQANNTINNFTVENAKAGVSSIGHFFKHIDLIEGWSSLLSTLNEHRYSIGTAAGIGFTATILYGLMSKKVLTESPKTRVFVATGMAFATVYTGVNYGLDIKLEPQVLTDIAIKVGIIGGASLITLKTTRLVLTLIKGSTDIISSGIRGVCTGGIFIVDRLTWGSLPAVTPSLPKKGKVVPPPSAKKEGNGQLTTPSSTPHSSPKKTKGDRKEPKDDRVVEPKEKKAENDGGSEEGKKSELVTHNTPAKERGDRNGSSVSSRPHPTPSRPKVLEVAAPIIEGEDDEEEGETVEAPKPLSTLSVANSEEDAAEGSVSGEDGDGDAGSVQGEDVEGDAGSVQSEDGEGEEGVESLSRSDDGSRVEHSSDDENEDATDEVKGDE